MSRTAPRTTVWMCSSVIAACCDYIQARAWSEAGAEEHPSRVYWRAGGQQCAYTIRIGWRARLWASLWRTETTLQTGECTPQHTTKITTSRLYLRGVRATKSHTNLGNGWSSAVRRCFWGAWSTKDAASCSVYTMYRAHRLASS